ncbi:MAG: GNAT family N-acetyltransferase, partial [Ignavibacteria bacterium]|nr:GNAT family N-acetyltransferase [Ignavibacteria bacterium]
NYIIRNMTETEVRNIALQWATEEGWNPGLNDSSAFYHTDPNGFFVGLLDNIPIACISTVSYGNNFGFLGFYIVKKEFRRKGYGLKIWNRALEYLTNQNIGLDGVIAQQANYIKSGFKLAYRNIRFEGIAKLNYATPTGIIPFSRQHFEQLINYDSNLFPATRKTFLELWVNQPEAATFVSLENEIMNGYATIRKCKVGYKIGPLFADSNDVANSLFIAANKFAGNGSIIYLDTPEVNLNAVNLAENHGMKKVFETARMYTKEQPNINLDYIYGVTTFELG